MENVENCRLKSIYVEKELENNMLDAGIRKPDVERVTLYRELQRQKLPIASSLNRIYAQQEIPSNTLINRKFREMFTEDTLEQSLNRRSISHWLRCQ